jgi:acyl-CoA reductase-like NAD-dependent aldehyde dehydrogenase
MSDRLPVVKTYKLFVDGAFPRSESGRTYQVRDDRARLPANVSRASRKDARDAVAAARRGFGRWSAQTAYNRGQVLYRIAEMLESRRSGVPGLLPGSAPAAVDAAVDLLVHYAGWADKISTVFGGANPVAGPYFAFTLPEPTGLVAVAAPQEDPLLGLVAVVAPVICSGNAAVVVASEWQPLPAVMFAEVLATSDLPAGVVNILTGSPAELFGWLAQHGEVNALDLTGATGEQRREWERAAAGTVKRVFVPRDGEDFTTPGTARLRAFLEDKSVWHPTGGVSVASGASY